MSAGNKRNSNLELDQAELQFNMNSIKSACTRSKGRCFKIWTLFYSHISLISGQYPAIISLQIGEWVVSAEQPSLQSGPSPDKITALSQAIAHEAKGHLSSDGAGVTDTSRSVSFLMFLPADMSAGTFIFLHKSHTLRGLWLHWLFPQIIIAVLWLRFGTTCVADP